MTTDPNTQDRPAAHYIAQELLAQLDVAQEKLTLMEVTLEKIHLLLARLKAEARNIGDKE